MMDMAPTCVLCPRLKNLMSVNLILVEDYRARWSKMEDCRDMEKSGAKWRSLEMWRSLEQCGVWSKVEESEGTWRSLEQCGERMCVLF